MHRKVPSGTLQTNAVNTISKLMKKHAKEVQSHENFIKSLNSGKNDDLSSSSSSSSSSSTSSLTSDSSSDSESTSNLSITSTAGSSTTENKSSVSKRKINSCDMLVNLYSKTYSYPIFWKN